MKKPFKWILLAVCIVTGSVTVFSTREFPSMKPRWMPAYPATAISIYMSISGGGILQAGDCNNAPVWSRFLGWIIVSPLALAAVPMSAIVDTILLPFDLFRGPAIAARGRGLDEPSRRAVCINHLMDIDLAKYDWAREHKIDQGGQGNMAEVLRYCKRPIIEVTNCPSGGSITLNEVGQNPTCTVCGHVLPEAWSKGGGSRVRPRN